MTALAKRIELANGSFGGLLDLAGLWGCVDDPVWTDMTLVMCSAVDAAAEKRR